MKYLGVLLIFLVFISGCETSTRTIFDPTSDDDETIAASVIGVRYPFNLTPQAPADLSFEIRLDKKFPCHLFSHFETTYEGPEIFVKPFVFYGIEPCTQTDPNLVRNYSYLFENPGKYLIHFYISENRILQY